MSTVFYADYKPRLVRAYIDFMSVVEPAAVTFHGMEDNGSEPRAKIIKYNLFPNVAKLESSLKSIFGRIVSEIDEEIKDISNKLDKLNLVAQHLIENEGLIDLYKDDKGSISHYHFHFNNLAEKEEDKTVVISENEAHAYLSLSYRYVKKVQRYLLQLMDNLKQVKQEEFAVPQHMIPNPNDATTEKPFAYFDYLITKTGVADLKNNFIPSEEDQEYYYVSYDKETETKTSQDQDPETGEWELYTEKFSNVLLNVLYKEYSKAKDLMDSAIISINDKKQLKFTVDLWIGTLHYLKAAAENNTITKKYEPISKAIEGLIKFLYEKYGQFCPKPDKRAQKILESSKLYQLPQPTQLSLPGPIHPGAFRWAKGEPTRLSTILHEKLNGVFIKNITLNEFHRIFSGGHPEQSFHLRWIDKHRNEVNKVTLLYLFKKLSENGLIDLAFDSPELLQKLAWLFRDADGKPLQHLTQSKSHLLKAKKVSTHTKSELDKIIAVMTT